MLSWNTATHPTATMSIPDVAHTTSPPLPPIDAPVGTKLAANWDTDTVWEHPRPSECLRELYQREPCIGDVAARRPQTGTTLGAKLCGAVKSWRAAPASPDSVSSPLAPAISPLPDTSVRPLIPRRNSTIDLGYGLSPTDEAQGTPTDAGQRLGASPYEFVKGSPESPLLHQSSQVTLFGADSEVDLKSKEQHVEGVVSLAAKTPRVRLTVQVPPEARLHHPAADTRDSATDEDVFGPKLLCHQTAPPPLVDINDARPPAGGEETVAPLPILHPDAGILGLERGRQRASSSGTWCSSDLDIVGSPGDGVLSPSFEGWDPLAEQGAEGAEMMHQPLADETPSRIKEGSEKLLESLREGPPASPSVLGANPPSPKENNDDAIKKHACLSSIDRDTTKRLASIEDGGTGSSSSKCATDLDSFEDCSDNHSWAFEDDNLSDRDDTPKQSPALRIGTFGSASPASAWYAPAEGPMTAAFASMSPFSEPRPRPTQPLAPVFLYPRGTGLHTVTLGCPRGGLLLSAPSADSGQDRSVSLPTSIPSGQGSLAAQRACSAPTSASRATTAGSGSRTPKQQQPTGDSTGPERNNSRAPPTPEQPRNSNRGSFGASVTRGGNPTSLLGRSRSLRISSSTGSVAPPSRTHPAIRRAIPAQSVRSSRSSLNLETGVARANVDQYPGPPPQAPLPALPVGQGSSIAQGKTPRSGSPSGHKL